MALLVVSWRFSLPNHLVKLELLTISFKSSGRQCSSLSSALYVSAHK